MDRGEVVGVATAGPNATGFAGLLSRIQRDSYRTLRWLAWLVASVGGLRFGSVILIGESLGAFVWGLAAIVLISIGLALACARERLPPEHFPSVAIGFEAIVGFALAAQILDWQNVLGARGWPLAGIPTVGLWVVIFANVIPLPPAQHLLGILLSTVGLPVAFFASLSLYDVPPDVGPEQNLRVFLQLLAPAFLASVVAFLSARRVYGLSLDLTATRRMGNYQLLEKLGEGGMGEVWRAKHRLLARPAAVKLIRGEGTRPGFEEQLMRFEREIRATVLLHSPHTIEVYDYGTTPDGTFYYVMELLEGLDLETLVAKHGPQPAERVVHILLQACDSLGEAHAAGLVHRDVKPANIFLCRYGRAVDFVKVLDFGMVKDASSDAGLTQMGTFAGTPHYAAPEMAQGLLEQIDARSDIYALGCVAFFLLTGRTPFVAETAMKLLMCHVNDTPGPPSGFVDNVPPELDHMVLDCLEKDRSRRPASTDVLAERLAAMPLGDTWTQTRASEWWTQHEREGNGLEGGGAHLRV